MFVFFNCMAVEETNQLWQKTPKAKVSCIIKSRLRTWEVEKFKILIN